MITPVEVDYIKRHAYVPEHVTGYVSAISECEPFLLEDYLYYKAENRLIFVSYPLKGPFEESVLKEVLNTAIKCVRPHHISIISPKNLTFTKTMISIFFFMIK